MFGVSNVIEKVGHPIFFDVFLIVILSYSLILIRVQLKHSFPAREHIFDMVDYMLNFRSCKKS